MNKLVKAGDVIARLRDGMTIGIGGWGPRRKPMALVREILRSPLKDLTVVADGGADVGMLCAAGKVKKLVFAFVSLDFIPLEPYFRAARQAGAIEVMEIDEGMLVLGLKAAGPAPFHDGPALGFAARRGPVARGPRGCARRLPGQGPGPVHGRPLCPRSHAHVRHLR